MKIFSVKWMPEAEFTFNNNIEYLSQKWTSKEIIRFLDRVEKVISLLEQNPFLYPKYNQGGNIYKCIVNEHIAIFFKILEEDSSIHLLTFWNSNQDPKKLQI